MSQALEYTIVLYCVKDGETVKKKFRSYQAARNYERRFLEEGGDACFWQTVVR